MLLCRARGAGQSRALAALIAVVLLGGCGSEDNDPGPGGVTVSEAQELDEAAEVVEKRQAAPAANPAPAPEGAPAPEEPANTE